MKGIALARKQKDGYGKTNKQQHVLFEEPPLKNMVSIGSMVSSTDLSIISSDSSSCAPNATLESSVCLRGQNEEEHSTRANAALATIQRTESSESALMTPSLTSNLEYNRVRLKFGVDIVDLSILTNFNVGKSTMAVLSDDPSRLASLLGLYQWSYLEFVPPRYGSSECLTAATNCLLARVHNLLAPNTESSSIFNRLYGKALQALQDAIGNENLVMNADVLCATQLLSLVELLASQDKAWCHHVKGFAQLVCYRSPSQFQTEFEKALFAAHVGAIISESLIHNTHCYLEQIQWQTLYKSLIQQSQFLTNRSPLAINLRLTMFSLPSLWHDVGEAVNGLLTYVHVDMASLEKRCRIVHSELIQWLESYKDHCVYLSLARVPESELALRRELFGSAMECLVVVKRLLATVCEPDRRSLETETQALAHLIIDLQAQPSPKYSWLFSGQEVGVAHTALLTKDSWEEDMSDKNLNEQNLATRVRYNTWSSTLRTSH